jgi:hypothetical protein
MFRNLTLGALTTALLLAITSTLVLGSTAPNTPLTLGPAASDEDAAPAGSSVVEAARLQARVFTINPGTSQARFIIDEILRGNQNTVIGVTDQVSGQITLDPAEPGNAQLGPV